MGVEYRLVKPDTGEAYGLDKAAMRPPLADWRKLMKGVDPVKGYGRMLEVMQPSEHAMWRIGSDTGECALTVLKERWTEEALAGLVETACLQEDDPVLSLAIARDILEWSGDDAVVLIPDTLDALEIAGKLGVRIRRPREVRSIFDVMKG